MVTEDGHVKILDFGLAKLTQPDSSGSGRTHGADGLGSDRGGNHPGDGRLHVARAGDGRRWTIARTSSRSARSSTRWRRGGGRSSAARRRRRWRRSSRTSRSRSPRSTPRSRRPCAGSWSGVSPRSHGSDTPRPRTSRATGDVRDHLSEARAPLRLPPETPAPAAALGGFRRRSPAAILLRSGVAGWHLRQSDYLEESARRRALHAVDRLGRLRARARHLAPMASSSRSSPTATATSTPGSARSAAASS